MNHLFLAQHAPFQGHLPQEIGMGSMGMSTGQVIFSIVASVVVQALFGFWARSKAEEYDVNPWVAFAAGFFLAYIGVRMVPLLKRDALLFRPKNRAALIPPRTPQSQGPHMHGQPVASADSPPGPAQIDTDGYLQCPACGARAKAGRKVCMSCGNALPT